MKNRVISGWVTVDGAAALDLAPEDRDHAARRAEHVAEAHGDEAGRDVVRARRNASTIHSQSAFDWPITVFGFTALSVETSTKRLDAELDGDLGDHLRRQRVVAHRLERVRLHQRHVLVRGGVEDDRRRVALEDAAHASPCCRRRRAPARSARTRARRRARARSRTAASRPGRRGSGACSRCARSGGRARSRSSRRRR